MRKLLGIIALVLCIQCAQAQSVGEKKNILQRFASWRETSMMRGVDTNYVVLPKKAWLVRANVFASDIIIFQDLYGIPKYNFISSRIRTGFSCKPTLSLAYRGLELGYGVDLAHRHEKDLRLQILGKRIGGEFHYCTFTGADIDLSTGISTGQYQYNDPSIRVQRINVSAYYVFNTERFSFPAGLKQNFFQKKSAGSVLLGATLNYTKIKSNTSIDSYNPELQVTTNGDTTTMNSGLVALGAGYGYNFIFKDFPLLLHASAMPMVAYTFNNRILINGEDITTTFQGSFRKPLRFCAIAKLAASYPITENIIIGANCSVNYSWSQLNDESSVFSHNIVIHGYLAFRF